MLAGRMVLVVETEFIIALGIQSVLESLDATRVTLATSPADARRKVDLWAEAALAVVEIERARPEFLEFIRELRSRGIPVLGISADFALASGVPELPGTPIMIKPVPDEEMRDSILALLDQKPLPDVT